VDQEFSPEPIKEEPAAPPKHFSHDEPQQLHPAVQKVWKWSNVISGTILSIGFGVAEFFFVRHGLDHPNWVPIVSPLIIILISALGWYLAGLQYKNWRYQLRQHDLVLSHGVIWKTRRCVARGRVQHMDINSGPLDRRWGLVHVSIYVAGALGSVGTIPGLRPEDAEALRYAILEGRATNA
jgi:uncharacterized protein